MRHLDLVRLSLCTLALASGEVIAFEGDRYQFFTGIGYTYDGNVFRTSKSGITPPKKDLIRSTYIGVGLNLPVSLQRFVVNARVNQTRFRDLGELDYNGRTLNASWLWQFGNDWSGRLGYSQSRTASDFSNLGGTTQNLRDQDRVFVDANVMLDPTHRLEMGFSQAKSENSTQANQRNDYTDNQLYFGIQYISPVGNSYGLRLAYDDLKLPNPAQFGATSIDNSHRKAVLDFTYAWKFSGVSNIYGRFGFEDREYKEFSGRDYSGFAWSVNYDWTPNPKSAVLFNFRREIDGLNDFASNYALLHGISIRPRWIVSSKVNVAWDFGYSRLEFRGEPGILNVAHQERKDKIKNYGMSVDYAPLPSASMSLSLRRDQRSSNISGIDFEATVVSGSLDFRF